MHRLLDNPVRRHAARLSAAGGVWTAGLVLLASAVLGALLLRFWMELDVHALRHSGGALRWAGVFAIAQSLLALPWAAVRGALVWRKLTAVGLVEEYRRSRMSSLSIALGTLAAALRPVLLVLAVSLGVQLIAAARGHGTEPPGLLWLHALLSSQAAAFAALGLWLAAGVRWPGAAIPVSLLVQAAATAAIWALNPIYRSLSSPEGWIYAALLPNPVTAAASALGVDVLRFSWVYEHLRAADYFYVYPPPWQTMALYLAAAGLLTGMLAHRIGQT
jgi:hypothetical protein